MSSFITEPSREIPVRWEADVVVCGGGPAGTAAALAAARNGAKTILLERHGCLGGLATGGLVLALPTFEDTDRPIIRGIGGEMRERMLETHECEYRWANGGSLFDPEAMKWVSIRMCKEAGVKILHHVWVAGAHVEDGAVSGVIVESKAGRLAVRGKLFIDATGDGDVFASAGAAFETSNQYIGLPFRLANVDVEAWEKAREADPKGTAEAMEAARVEGGWDSYMGLTPMPTPDGFLWGNNMLKELDGLDPEDLTYVEVEGREAIRKSIEVLRDRMPGFEGAWLVDTAAQVGVRRTRRLIGEYVMTGEDTSQFDFRAEDSIGRGNDFRKSGIAYDIPYRSLLPREVDSLLVAGRCLSCDHEALEPLREIHICWVMGEAAGLAAAMALEQGRQPRNVPVLELQDRLRAAGVALAD
ncbi:MAG TPA: FAD-dependent oxidoreductase [Armatimonadota bacterium]|nr:FAD-dependent oxidoreductase [Armatimonadota bacterium]